MRGLVTHYFGRSSGAACSRPMERRKSNMVKRAMLAGFAMVFAVGLSVAGQDNAAKSGSWSGVVTNDMCGAKDASAAKAECTSKCVKSHGAKYALYDEADKKVYILEPQDKADGHAGARGDGKGDFGWGHDSCDVADDECDEGIVTGGSRFLVCARDSFPQGVREKGQGRWPCPFFCDCPF